MAKPIRIQKALSDGGILSRRKTEEYIKAGRITVNGHRAQPGNPVDIQKDIIAIDGKRVFIARKKENVYIMLNKPRGYVTTTSDELGRRCVSELVEDVGARVYPIGRLDRDSEGLLLFTNDGQLANLIMHPSHHVSKTYRVTVRPDITDEQAVKLSSGVNIGEDGNVEMTQPAIIHVMEKQPGRVVLQMSITEGKNRQIRRMCEAVGLEVVRLKRISVGPLKLGMVQPGKWRELKKSEVIALRNAAKPASQQEAVPQDKPQKHVGSFGTDERRGNRRKDHFVGGKNKAAWEKELFGEASAKGGKRPAAKSGSAKAGGPKPGGSKPYAGKPGKPGKPAGYQSAKREGNKKW